VGILDSFTKKRIDSHLKKIQDEEMKIKETLLKFIHKSDSQTIELEKINSNQVEPETLKKWMNEIKFWDIKIEKKWTFLHLFFNLPELFSLCSKQNIEMQTDENFLLSSSPQLQALFEFDDQVYEESLISMGIKDEELKSIMNEKDDENGETALHRACKKGQIAVAKLLIDAKCDVLATNHSGDLALNFAINEELVKLLETEIKSKTRILMNSERK